MRRIILSLLAVMFISASAEAQKREYITVRGKVNFPPSQEHQEKFPFVLRDKPSSDSEVFQTIQLNADSTYMLRVPVDTPRMYSLDVFGWDRISFWAENDDLTIDFRGEDTAKVKIKNPPYIFIESEGKDNQLINMLNWEVYQNYQNVIAIGKIQHMASQGQDTALRKAVTDLMMGQYDNLATRAKWYVKTFKNDPQVVYALSYISPRRDAEFILSYVEPLIEKYPWLKEAQEIKERIDLSIAAAKKTEIGAKFIDITQANPAGQDLNLYDYLKDNKYVLVDFWASWCGPCRKENPHIVAAYNAYKDKGFGVWGISLDNKKELWVNAIEKDGLPWPQVSDLNGWKNEAAQYYNITAIPMNFLLDSNGRIVAKNLRGEKLEAEIAKLLAK